MATDNRTASVGAVVRDYIPEGEEPTAIERQRFHLRQVGPTSRPTNEFAVPDFVPAEGQEMQEIPSPEDAHQRAMEAARKTGLTYRQRSFRDARNLMRRGDMNTGNLIDYLRHLSPYDRDVHLIAEARDQKRSAILDEFPKPDPSIAKMFKKPRKHTRRGA